MAPQKSLTMLVVLIALLFVAIGSFAMADSPTPTDPASGVFATPTLLRPTAPPSLKTKALQDNFNDAWERYEERVNYASAFMVDAISRLNDQLCEDDRPLTRSGGPPKLEEPHGILQSFLDDFPKSGEIPESFRRPWWHTALAPADAVGLWARREYAHAISQLEADYVSLATECLKDRNPKGAGELRKQLGRLLESNWTRQTDIKLRRQKLEADEYERSRQERLARQSEREELEQTVPRDQVDPLRRNGVNSAELVDGKAFLAKNSGGRLLWSSLKGTRWTNIFGEAYEWDDSGLLWYVQDGTRKFIYVEYETGNECTIRSSHVSAAKLLVDMKSMTMTPLTAAGRKDHVFKQKNE